MSNRSAWRIERSEYPHGDTFELELTIRWRVYHASMPTTEVLTIEDSEEAEYNGQWVTTSPGKIVEVRLEQGEGGATQLVIERVGGELERVELKPPGVG